MANGIHIVAAGAAGQGVETVAQVLAKTLARAGFGVASERDYMSRVRGGHNFARIRVATETPWACEPRADLLIALTAESYDRHRQTLAQDARIVHDPEAFALPVGEDRGLAVHLSKLAREAGGSVMANTVAVGAALRALGLPTEHTRRILAETFADKPGMPEKNAAALEAGYEAAGAAGCTEACFLLPEARYEGVERLYIDGSSALGLSALASGCRFFSGYPMTPATGVMNYLAARQERHGIVVEQAEDEIAALNMVLGASFAGLRSLTATSGGGFALMVEALSLAGITETPAVIILGMRPGPATGMATRTEQGDLLFALHAGHGEFPRAVLSAATLEGAFYGLNRAFDLADRYQTPVIFLTDQHFNDSARTIEPLDFERLLYDRHLVDAGGLSSPYIRYRDAASGVSPRALPGQNSGEIVMVDSHEHDERGNISEDIAVRRQQMDKRLRKLTGIAAHMEEPLTFGSSEPEVLLLGWGSTYGVLRQAVTDLETAGASVGLLHFTDLWPLPQTKLQKAVAAARLTISVEHNATGQFAALLRSAAGVEPNHQILKYDGRPFESAEISREVLARV